MGLFEVIFSLGAIAALGYWVTERNTTDTAKTCWAVFGWLPAAASGFLVGHFIDTLLFGG